MISRSGALSATSDGIFQSKEKKTAEHGERQLRPAEHDSAAGTRDRDEESTLSPEVFLQWVEHYSNIRIYLLPDGESMRPSRSIKRTVKATYSANAIPPNAPQTRMNGRLLGRCCAISMTTPNTFAIGRAPTSR